MLISKDLAVSVQLMTAKTPGFFQLLTRGYLWYKKEHMDDKAAESRVGELLQPHGPLIFLSYAKEDEKKVKAIYRKLRTEHLNPWLDIANLRPGEEWDKAIISAIRSARFIIVLLSKHSVSKRGYVQKEIKEALDAADKIPDGDIFIIPVRLEECPVPERLSKWQWIDIFRSNGFRKVVDILRENLGSKKLTISDLKISAKVIVMGDTDHEAMFELRKTICLIGRSDLHSTSYPDIDLTKFDSKRRVSRNHALIIRSGNFFIIKDCGSSNGTIINDSIFLRANQTRVLNSGDKLRLGDTILHFIVDVQYDVFSKDKKKRKRPNINS